MDSAGFYKVQPWHIFKRVLWGFRVYKGYFHVFMSSTRIWQDFYGHTWLNLPITKSHSFEAITFGSPSQSYQGRCVCVLVYPASTLRLGLSMRISGLSIPLSVRSRPGGAVSLSVPVSICVQTTQVGWKGYLQYGKLRLRR